MASNVLPSPLPAVSLYVGKVMHARMMPKKHRFSYKVFSILIDIDQLKNISSLSRLFSINKFNLLSFHERDHGLKGRDQGADSALNIHIREEVSKAGIHQNISRIQLLCYPRIFGYVFNPLSVFFCYGTDDTLCAVVYEVRNRVSGLHHYILPVKQGELSASGLRQECDKDFYVSPFLPMQLRYFFRLTMPDESVAIRILEKQEGEPILAATFHGNRRPFNTMEIVRVMAHLPFMGVKVLVGIHYEALRLWLKGLPFMSYRSSQVR